MRLKRIWIDGFKNITNFEVDFSDKNGLTTLIGNNGSGKSNILEAISSIFSNLYRKSDKSDFEYELEYVIEDKEIKICKNDKRRCYLDNKIISYSQLRLKDLLPAQVIAVYSGEELRLWENYYEHFYKRYIKLINGVQQGTPRQSMIYINKYYWNIALLTFLLSNLDDNMKFVADDLNIKAINNIQFTFNLKNLEKCKNVILKSSIETINPEKLLMKDIALDDLKIVLDSLSERDIFNKFVQAYMPKNNKLITEICITFNDGISTNGLSEGEKKLILIKAVLEIVVSENSLILFDEPDAHIHEGRKMDICNIIKEYTQFGRSIVLTTHSPTLTYSLNRKQTTRGRGC